MSKPIHSAIDIQPYLEYLSENFPHEYNTLNIHSIKHSPESWKILINQRGGDFSLEGRGSEYLQSIETSFLARKNGVKHLLKCLNNSLEFSHNYTICDLLAGNGYINKVANHIFGSKNKLNFINSDLSFFMFNSCLSQGLFSVWQSADDLFWLKSSVMDGVLLAYGTHHIPRKKRLKVVKEATRVLKEGGRFVLHDFEVGSRMNAWFHEIVSSFSKTKHYYPHFERQELLELAEGAGLKDITINIMEDPFIITANSLEQGKIILAEYLVKMYGMTKLYGQTKKVIELMNDYFLIRYTQISPYLFEVQLMREAIVCCGTKK